MYQFLDSFSSLIGVPANFLLIGIIVLAATFIITRIGRRSGVALVFAAYPAFLLYRAFPFEAAIASHLSEISGFLLACALLGIAYLLSYFFLVRFMGARSIYSAKSSLSEAVLIALSLTVLLTVASYHVLPAHASVLAVWPFLDTLCQSGSFFFFGLLAPLVACFFFMYE